MTCSSKGANDPHKYTRDSIIKKEFMKIQNGHSTVKCLHWTQHIYY